jgi:acyl carrier protein phosphodiesterase
MHRNIDHFTDSHDLFRQSKRIFYTGFEKHSGILVDIYLDHLLAANFSKFSNIDLDVFSKGVYGVYQDARNIIPAKSIRFLDYVIQNNIYQSYSHEEGIHTVLKHLSHRLSHGVQLQDSISLFNDNQIVLINNFTKFFSEAQIKFNQSFETLE